MTILLTTPVHVCRLDFHITVGITKMITLTLEHVRLEGRSCDDSYVTVYKTLPFGDDDQIFDICANALIYDRELRSDWNMMGVLWYRSKMASAGHMLTSYHGEPLQGISESPRGTIVLLVTTRSY